MRVITIFSQLAHIGSTPGSVNVIHSHLLLAIALVHLTIYIKGIHSWRQCWMETNSLGQFNIFFHSFTFYNTVLYFVVFHCCHDTYYFAGCVP